MSRSSPKGLGDVAVPEAVWSNLVKVTARAGQAIEDLGRALEAVQGTDVARKVMRSASAAHSAHVRWHVKRRKLKTTCGFCAALGSKNEKP